MKLILFSEKKPCCWGNRIHRPPEKKFTDSIKKGNEELSDTREYNDNRREFATQYTQA